MRNSANYFSALWHIDYMVRTYAGLFLALYSRHPHRQLKMAALSINSEIPPQFLARPKLALYWHPSTLLHDIPDHPEQPARIQVIFDALQKEFGNKIAYRTASLGEMDKIRLFHTDKMIKRFEDAWQTTFTAYQSNKKVVHRSLDGGDTKVMHTTKEAALRGVGAVIDALDHIYQPPTPSNSLGITTAFCLIRPPGHHAEPDKSCGFCIFNNVAVGARYAQRRYGVEKVAILDFDVHHGNGHEEGFENDPSVFYGSTHELHNFPGTGKDPSPFVGENARRERDRRIVDRYLHSGPESRAEFFRHWDDILQEMERFSPDLILLSTGFDAHDDDPLSDVQLEDGDYRVITQKIVLSALRIGIKKHVAHTLADTSEDTSDKNIHPQTGGGGVGMIPIVSVLEGGYDLQAIARSALQHVGVLLEGAAGVADMYYYCDSDKQEEKEFEGDEVAALQESLKEMGLVEGRDKIEEGAKEESERNSTTQSV